MITQERLKRVYHYNPSTGIFKRREGAQRTGRVVKPEGSTTRYLLICVDGKEYRAHRLSWLYMYGEWPRKQIDHIDGDGLNNAIVNLRDVTPLENCRNRPKSKANNTGIVGVFWNSNKNAYVAKIMVGGRHIHLKQTKDKFEAVCARKAAENKYNFHKNYGR